MVSYIATRKNEEEKMRNRTKRGIVDYQINKEESIGLKIHCQVSFDNCQSIKRLQDPRTL